MIIVVFACTIISLIVVFIENIDPPFLPFRRKISSDENIIEICVGLVVEAVEEELKNKFFNQPQKIIMKKISKDLMLKPFLSLLMIALFQTILLAQDNGGAASESSTTSKSVSVTSQTNDWYASPWVWVAGAAVFILLLVALLRGRSDGATTASRTDRVTVTKTTSDDVV
jgi:hypothetical protein